MRCDLRRLALLAILPTLLGSCAAGTAGLEPAPAMPAARAGLRPEYRIFYDALSDYGDWVLIEPYGYLFRPSGELLGWRPYQSGFWAPTDSYGWVWISSEPFGWATYHYGRWMYDDYQGWVWRPGLEWGPAWVTWQMSDQYVGWSPLTWDQSSSGSGARVPGGGFLYTTVDRMGTTDLSLHLKRQSDLGESGATLKPLENSAEAGGVQIELGPPIARIERVTGRSLTRVRVDDALSTAGGGSGPEVHGGRSRPGAESGVEDMRRAAEQNAREARALTGRANRLPARLPVVRASGSAVRSAAQSRFPRGSARALRDSAAADSAK